MFAGNNKFGAPGGNLFATQTPQNQSGGAALFGNRSAGAFTTPGIGVAAGTNASGLFNAAAGAGNAAAGGMFRAAGTGLAAGTTGGIFGQQQLQVQQQQQQQAAAGGLFGQATAATAGNALFQTPQQRAAGIGGTTGGLFQTPTSQAVNTGIFGAKQTPGATPFSTGFGAAAQSGTTVAFKAITDSEQTVKNNRTQTVQLRYQTITAMKEYGTKSVEELRLEDYVANRKGPQAAGGAAAGGLFGGQQQTAAAGGLFGAAATQAGGILGQQTGAAGLFGNKQPAQQAQLGAAGGIFAQQQKAGLFGQTTAATGLTSQAGGGLFAQTAQQQAGGLFGQAGQQQVAGGIFAQQQAGQQQNALFAQKTLGVGLGTTGQAGGLFQQQQQAQGGLGLGAAAAGTGGLFGNKTGGLGLGAGQTTGLSLGAAGGATSSLFAGGLGATGAAGQLKLGTGTGLGVGLGGQTGLGLGAAKPGGLSLGGGLGLGGGQIGGTTGLGFGTGLAAGGINNQVTSLGTDAAAAAQQHAQLQLQLATLHNSPFGDSPLFKTAMQDAKSRSRDLPASATKSSTTTPQQMKVSSKAIARLRPQPLVGRPAAKAQLFEGLEDDIPGILSSPDFFVPRSTIKKLVIPQRSANSPANSTASGGPSPAQDTPTRIDPVPSDDGSLTSLSQDVSFPATPLGRLGVRATPQQQATMPTAAPLSGDGSFTTSGASSSTSPKTPASPPLAAAGQNGVRLTRAGYYTEPSIDELNRMAAEEGSVVVNDFVVGQRQLGKIEFPGRTDVTGVNLDEIVMFGQSEVTVYPDDDKKPPVGVGLNKRAVVTLHSVWPKDKATGQPIRSPERLEAMNYRSRIQKSARKIGAEFIDYEASHGSWSFQVEHFSKYGLPDEESDPEDESVPPVKKKLMQPTAQRLATGKASVEPPHASLQSGPLPVGGLFSSRLPFTTMSTNEGGMDPKDVDSSDDGNMPDQDFLNNRKEDELLGGNTNQLSMASSRHFAASIGLNPHRVQLMKASFFTDDGDEDGMNLAAGAPKASSTQVYQPSSTGGLGLFTSSLSNNESPGGQSMVVRPGSAVAPSPYRQSRPAAAVAEPRNDVLSVVSAQRCLMPMPADQSITNGKLHVVSDAGLMFGRSFRVGWGHGWKLVHSGATVSGGSTSGTAAAENRLIPGVLWGPSGQSSSLSASYTVQIEQLHASPLSHRSGGAVKDRIVRSMQVQLDHSSVTVEGDIPLVTPVDGINCLSAHAAQAKNPVEGMADEDTARLDHAAQVWSLASALWGQLPASNVMPSSEETDSMESGLKLTESYEEQMARRRAVSQWLSSVTARDIAEVVQSAGGTQDVSSYLEALFALLTGQQVAAACRLAIANGDSNLARLIGQCCGSASFRENLAVQLQQWLEHKTDKFMSPERLRVYCLLAGAMTWNGSDSSVHTCTCDGIDWRRAFAVHLWYGSPYEASIADGFARYLKAFKGHEDSDSGVSREPYAVAPRPHYAASCTDGDEALSTADFQLRDTCFHLLRLYCKQTHRLQRTLDPATHTTYVLDYQLSWPLFCVLQSLHYEHMPESLVARLHCAFAAQLMSLDMWPWAVMVALHIPQPALRESLVNEILRRCCTLSDTADLSDDDEFLVEQLSVPADWIHRAKAMRAHYQHQHLLMAQHNLLAGEWLACHDAIVKHIASPAIVNGDTQLLLSMLEELEPLYRSALIPTWSKAGQIYLDYLRLASQLQAATEEQESIMRREERTADLVSLASRLELLPVHSALDRLCRSEMSKACACRPPMDLATWCCI